MAGHFASRSERDDGFVTHDQEEAMEVANRIVIFSSGGLEQVGPPREVYDQPVNEFVARFIGVMNILELEVAAGCARWANWNFRPMDETRSKVADRFLSIRGADLVRSDGVSIITRCCGTRFSSDHAARRTGFAKRFDPPGPDEQRRLCSRGFVQTAARSRSKSGSIACWPPRKRRLHRRLSLAIRPPRSWASISSPTLRLLSIINPLSATDSL